MKSWCESIGVCVNDLTEISELGIDIGNIIEKTLESTRQLDLSVNVEGATSLDDFKNKVDALNNEWEKVWRTCDEFKDPIVEEHGIPDMW